MATASAQARASYEPGEFYDEAVDERGRPRPGYEEILAALADEHPAALADRVAGAIDRIGATFRAGDEAEPFPVCPIPRVICADEWDRLERGLAQRARALNAFIDDVYG